MSACQKMDASCLHNANMQYYLKLEVSQNLFKQLQLCSALINTINQLQKKDPCCHGVNRNESTEHRAIIFISAGETEHNNHSNMSVQLEIQDSL